MIKKISIDSVNELHKVAEAVIEALGTRSVVAFFGPMGAGKTTLISAIMEYLGSKDTITSPTFALVNQYSTAMQATVYHFDFYRINSLSEAFDLGYEEYFYSGDLCLIEWPEKIEELLPDDSMVVRITVDDENSRTFEFEC